MKNKRLLLLAPDDYHLYKLIERNLTHLGFEVVTLVHNAVKFEYKNLGQRIYNLYRKTIDKDNSYKMKIKLEHTAKTLVGTIESSEFFDYCLVLRSDFFHVDVLTAAKRNSGEMVSYHYDGLQRNPSVIANIPLFDRFYVFDDNDVDEKRKTLLSHNFYFDYDTTIAAKETLYDVFYLGFYSKSREDLLLSFYELASKILKSVKFQIVFPLESRIYKKSYSNMGIECIDHVIPFEEYLMQIENTNIIVDFLIGDHNGLSFRIYEGLKYKKKVITTNIHVQYCDFYNDSNFYILSTDSLHEDKILEFLQRPYVDIEESIRLKYSFTMWIKSILNC